MKQAPRNPIVSKIITGLSVCLCLFVLAYTAGFFDALGIYSIPQTVQRAIVLTFLLLISFLIHPLKKGRQGIFLWLDVLLALMSISGLLYLLFFFHQVEVHFEKYAQPAAFEMALAMSTLVLLIEGIRRVAGLSMALVTLVFLIYPFTTQYLPGIFASRAYSLERITTMLYPGTQGILGIPMGVAATIVIMFVIFGQLMVDTGGGKFFIDLAVGWLGRFRGGPAKAAVLASALFGTISGSGAANVATTGVITIPLMKKTGYEPAFAGGVEAVASTGGILMPPVMGAVAFIIAEYLNISYALVCYYSIVPAILYFLALLIMVDLEAARKDLKGLNRQELPSVKKTMRNGWFYLMPLVILIFLLAQLGWSPQKSAFWALIAFWVISLFKKETRLNLTGIIGIFKGTAKSMCTVGLACAGAGIVVGSISMTGLGFKFSGALIDICGGSMIVLLILTAAACYVMGMGIGGITLYVTLAVLIAPTLVKMGALPIAAHLFVFWWGCTAYITPPIAMNAFVACGISGASPIKTAFEATRLGICILIVPFLFVLKPVILLIGSPGEIVIGVVTAILATAALAAALAGYLLTPLKWQRVPLIAASICLLAGWISSIVGVGLIAWVLLEQIKQRRVKC